MFKKSPCPHLPRACNSTQIAERAPSDRSYPFSGSDHSPAAAANTISPISLQTKVARFVLVIRVQLSTHCQTGLRMA